MAGIETAVEAARRYIIKRPRLTRLLDNANARVLMLIAPAGFGKTTLAREWAAERPHVWYRGTTATADVAALAAGFSETISEVIPEAGMRAVNRMRAAGTPEDDVEIIAELFAEDLADWPSDTWLVFDDYQFAMEAKAPERFVDLLLRNSPVRLLLTSRRRPGWASARRLLYGELYELGRNELAMDHDEAASVLAHRQDAPAAGLVALAEGWPAVIGLAALTGEIELPEGGLPDALYEYFAEELFQAASPGVQQGLCKLALAPSLSEGITELLLGEDTAEMLSEGVRLGFLTGRIGNLELHPLLRTFLDAKTREEATSNLADAERLARHFAQVGELDDAFALIEGFFSEDLFVDLFESNLQTMLAEARLATVSRWLELASAKHIDAPVVDVAESEIAFHQGHRRKAEALALRATQRLDDSHRMRSRSFYIAAMSAHMDYYNERARDHCQEALACATNLVDRRYAVWGQLNVSLDLEGNDVDDLLADLVALDDGSALSEVRLAVARLQVAIRRGTLAECSDSLASAEHVVERVRDPLALSSFYSSKAAFLALQGRYSDALAGAARCENHAKDVRLAFVIPHAKRIRAIAEMGLRHFSRCKQLVSWLEISAVESGDIFIGLEARLLRARLFIAQGLASRGVSALEDTPARFPWEGERGEYFATLALALACSGDCSSAARLVREAADISETVEVRTLHACVDAILSLEGGSTEGPDRAVAAARRALEVGCVDSFVVAYRGYPELLAQLALDHGLRDALIEIVDRAHDWSLLKAHGFYPPSKLRARSSPLSAREEEVLGLISHGLTNKEIAKTLYISEATAKVHVRHILEKFGVRTRTEAALRASAEQS